MSTLGKIAAVNLSATTNTLIYTVPAGSSGIDATVNICNRNSGDVAIRLAIVDGLVASLTVADWIEYDTVIAAGGVIERSGLKIYVGQSVVAYSDTSNVSVQVWG